MIFTTDIQSNGSKWAGEAPDSIATLIDVLGKYALDRTFEDCGNFIEHEPVNLRGERIGAAGSVSFFGNFFNLSHVFSIVTNDPAIIEPLSTAIRANQQRADYLAQPSPAEAKAAKEAENMARDRKRDEERRKRLRRELAQLEG